MSSSEISLSLPLLLEIVCSEEDLEADAPADIREEIYAAAAVAAPERSLIRFHKIINDSQTNKHSLALSP